MSLVAEIAGLREALKLARDKMVEDDDLVKLGAVVARLTDSVGRALLAQSKLAVEGDGSTSLRAETDRLLRELGLGEL